MTVETNVTYTGQKKTDVLSGQLRIEDGNNRMVLFDGTVTRMIIGLYKGEILIAISKTGTDVFDALDA